MKKICLPLVFCLGFFLLIFGSTEEPWASMIKEGEINGIKFMTGGVGLDERNLMAERERAFNLKVVSATSPGNYLAGLKIIIHNADGQTVVDTLSTGPWFYAALPTGEYRVTVVRGDQPKIKPIRVEQGLKTIMFHWKE